MSDHNLSPQSAAPTSLYGSQGRSLSEAQDMMKQRYGIGQQEKLQSVNFPSTSVELAQSVPGRVTQ
jgi:hypothetical protein